MTACAARSSTTSFAGAATQCPGRPASAVFERDPGGLLSAVRMYDDVEAPVDSGT